MTTDPPTTPGVAKLGPALIFTGLNSLGTGAVQTGIFFLLHSAYEYSARENFVYGLFLYGAYIFGALSIGPMLKRRTAAKPTRKGWLARWSTRAVLTALVLCQIMLNMLPQAVTALTENPVPGEWVMWTVGIGFGLMTGMMWPIVESFLSGGRTGKNLRRATGAFNIVWSSAVVASFWLMAPLLEDHPLQVITLLAAVQLASLACVACFPAEPGAHLSETLDPHPAHWERLLRWFRVLLPIAYVLCGTLSPLLPSVIARLGVGPGWMTPVASAWVTSRVAMFVLFARWDGWHGRRWMPLLACVCLIGGFLGVVLSPTIAEVFTGGPEGGNPQLALAFLLLTLGVFGIGNATAYVGALYYAMELNNAQVDSGGVHEALIGLGYWSGPVLGLVAILCAGVSEGPAFEGWLIGLVLLVTAAGLGIGGPRRRGKREKRDR